MVEKLHSEFVNEVELTVETIQPIELSEYTLSHPLTSTSVSTQYKNELAEGIIKISGSPGRNIVISMENEIELKSTNFESLKFPLEVLWSGGQTGSVSEARRMALPVTDSSEFIIPLGEHGYSVNRKPISITDKNHEEKNLVRTAHREALNRNGDDQKLRRHLAFDDLDKEPEELKEDFNQIIQPKIRPATVYLFIKPLIQPAEPVMPGVYEGEITLNVEYVLNN